MGIKSLKTAPLVAGALALVLGTAAAPALAKDIYQFSAIAYSPATHAIGTAYDAKSQDEAETTALARCAEHADDCESVNWSGNACSALAIEVSGSGGWGAAWGNTYAEAALGAHNTCMEFNDSCQVYAWVCNSMAAPN